MYILDYHLHSNNSPDAFEPMERMVLSGIKKGVNELVFTDHIEINEGDFIAQKNLIDKGYSDFLEVQEKYKNQIILKFGLEIGQGIWNVETYNRILAEYENLDYVLCSIHRAFNEEDYFVRSFQEDEVDYIMEEYLKEAFRYVTELDFDCMGHIDYPLRYIKRRNYHVDIHKYLEQFSKILEIIIKKGKGIELNVSGLTTAHGETMPSLPVLNLYKQLGGKVITIGSDSHKSETLSESIKDGLTILKKAGFNEICKFTKRKMEFIKI